MYRVAPQHWRVVFFFLRRHLRRTRSLSLFEQWTWRSANQGRRCVCVCVFLYRCAQGLVKICITENRREASIELRSREPRNHLETAAVIGAASALEMWVYALVAPTRPHDHHHPQLSPTVAVPRRCFGGDRCGCKPRCGGQSESEERIMCAPESVHVRSWSRLWCGVRIKSIRKICWKILKLFNQWYASLVVCIRNNTIWDRALA